MKKRINIILIIGIILILSGSLAFSLVFGDLWARITGKAVNIKDIPHSENIVGYWAFENNFLDSSGKENSGTCTGTCRFSFGKSGNSADFKKDSFIEIPEKNQFDFIYEMSFTFWIKRNSDGIMKILSKKTSSIPGWEVYLVNDKIIFSGKSFGDISCDGIPLGKWVHIAGVHSVAAGEINLYVDGNKVPCSLREAHSVLARNDESLLIGKSQEGFMINAQLDELFIWNRGLNNEEIKKVYELTGG